MIEDIASAGGAGALADTAMRHAHEIFHAQAAVLLPDESGRVAVRAASDPRIGRAANDLGVAQWVFDHRQPAGRGTDTLPAADALYVPLAASRGAVGVLALRHDDSAHLLTPDQRSLLDAVADQVALAIERDQLTQAARRSQLHAETENLRSSLLSSVSHDLRTPLSVITGASSALLEGRQGAEAQRELVQTIRDESERLTRLVGNLLDITRLESLSVDIRKEWHPIEEVIGSALRHLDRQLRGRRVTTDLPPMLPLVQMDGVLIEQVLVNLVENAAKYAPDGGAIRVAAAAGDGRLLVEVSDDGPGLAPGESSRVFEKFYRGDGVRGQRGAGLGLSICRAIVEAHGGRIWADTKAAPDHGAVFRFTLPAESPAPHGAMSAAPEGGAA
jgi:two-component system sensor histidine kinase KdpD